MREMFDFADTYKFKAPLAGLDKNFDIKHFSKLCNALAITTTTSSVAMQIFVELSKFDEQIASFDYLSKHISRKSANIRHHLSLLEKEGLVRSEFITTDRVRRRRGKLFYLTLPTAETINLEQNNHTIIPEFELIPSNQVVDIDTQLDDIDERLMETLVIRYLVKGMRTNRKDTKQKLVVNIPQKNSKSLKVIAEAEMGRLMYVYDLAYYSGAITWLYTHIKKLLVSDNNISETYILPIDQLISVSKNIPFSDATSGGYSANAIKALKRISSTTFTVSDLPSVIKEMTNVQGLDYFIKLFRLEAVVTYKDHKGKINKAVSIQFPKRTIDGIVKSIESNLPLDSFILIDQELLTTSNEIEILLGLWARDQFYSSTSDNRSYSWNELRETIAPNATLPEFKRKFSSIIVANADSQYKAKIHESTREKITDTFGDEGAAGTIYLSGSSSNKVVEYGRATVHGFSINIGYSHDLGYPVLFFRRDMSGLALIQKRKTI